MALPATELTIPQVVSTGRIAMVLPAETPVASGVFCVPVETSTGKLSVIEVITLQSKKNFAFAVQLSTGKLSLALQCVRSIADNFDRANRAEGEGLGYIWYGTAPLLHIVDNKGELTVNMGASANKSDYNIVYCPLCFVDHLVTADIALNIIAAINHWFLRWELRARAEEPTFHGGIHYGGRFNINTQEGNRFIIYRWRGGIVQLYNSGFDFGDLGPQTFEVKDAPPPPHPDAGKVYLEYDANGTGSGRVIDNDPILTGHYVGIGAWATTGATGVFNGALTFNNFLAVAAP